MSPKGATLCCALTFVVLGVFLVVFGTLELHTADDWSHTAEKERCEVTGFTASGSCTYECNCHSSKDGSSDCDTCIGNTYKYDAFSPQFCNETSFVYRDSTCRSNGPAYHTGRWYTCYVKQDCSAVDFRSPASHRTVGIVLVAIGAVFLSPFVAIVVGGVGFLLSHFVRKIEMPAFRLPAFSLPGRRRSAVPRNPRATSFSTEANVEHGPSAPIAPSGFGAYGTDARVSIAFSEPPTPTAPVQDKSVNLCSP